MQLNNLEHIINFTIVKVSRIADWTNLSRGNLTLILISVFYIIFHSLIYTSLAPVVRHKR